MEKVCDLLNPYSEDLKVRGDTNNGFYVKGLLKDYVKNEKEMMELYKRGCDNRHIASNNVNKRSSRSHCILTIKIKKYDKIEEKTMKSIFNLVDLAGSEACYDKDDNIESSRVSNTINLSLSVLGNVINTLVENITKGKNNHVPFRDSVLTKLLKKNLTGNCMTALILCCSTCKTNVLLIFLAYNFYIKIW